MCGSIKVDYIDEGRQSGFAIIPETPLSVGAACSI